MKASSGIYRVKAGDTLTAIARATARSVPELVRLNGLENPDRLQVGQVLYLTEERAFGVQALFLDALHHPIANLPYRLVYDGKTHEGRTGSNGLSGKIVTQDGTSSVEVWIRDVVSDAWRCLVRTVSGVGFKLISLRSPAIFFSGQLEPHPPGAPFTPPPASAAGGASKTPQQPAAPTGEATKNNPAVRTKTTKGRHGESVMAIGVVLPQKLLDYMAAYDGQPITEGQWKEFAKNLECEVNVLKAIAIVESGGRSAFWVVNDQAGHKVHAPKINFERHTFSRLTSRRYDQTNPDISWRKAYLSRSKAPVGSPNASLHDKRVDPEDLYDEHQAYMRLVKAWSLDEAAAIQSTSWGKFQIMGENHKRCKVGLDDFVSKMCRNEAGQVELLANFIRNQRPLWEAVKAKDWARIAKYYNGDQYKNYDYDTKLKQAYEKLNRSSA